MAKRFLNLYRLVRARRTGASLARFLGEDGRPPEYPAVVFLLALATGLDPRVAAAIVEKMAAGAGLSAAVKKLAAKPIGVGAKSPADAKLEFLQKIFDAGEFAVAPSDVTSLAPIVARYSFHHLHAPAIGS